MATVLTDPGSERLPAGKSADAAMLGSPRWVTPTAGPSEIRRSSAHLIRRIAARLSALAAGRVAGGFLRRADGAWPSAAWNSHESSIPARRARRVYGRDACPYRRNVTIGRCQISDMLRSAADTYGFCHCSASRRLGNTPDKLTGRADVRVLFVGSSSTSPVRAEVIPRSTGCSGRSPLPERAAQCEFCRRSAARRQALFRTGAVRRLSGSSRIASCRSSWLPLAAPGQRVLDGSLQPVALDQAGAA